MRLFAALLALATAVAVSARTPTWAADLDHNEPAAAATVETEPVAHSGDAAVDPAIWFDQADRARSLIIGADQYGALETYALSGQRVQRIPNVHPTNVDVRDDLVVAVDGETAGGALLIYAVDPATRLLSPLATVPTRITPHGLCLYRSPKSGTLYAFPDSLSGRVEEWKLNITGTTVTAQSVRLFNLGRTVEGCVADDATGALYVAERQVGIWRYGAEPDSTIHRTLVDGALPERDGHLTAAVEGLAIAGDRLYASSQGTSDFTVYGRIDNAYLGRFRVSGTGNVDGCHDTVGIEATSRPLGPRFPSGVFVCQDGYNVDGRTVERQNFKLVPLDRVVLPIGRLPPVHPDGR